LLIKNMKNGSIVKGMATTSNTGRSGNYNKIFVDEADFLPYGESVLAAIRMACKRGIKLISTVSEKPITMFSRIEAGAPDNGFHKQFIHWSEYRSQSWFDQVSKAMRADQIARELEGIRQGSTLALVYPSFKRDIHVKENIFEKGLPIGISMDFGRADLTNVKFWQDTVIETHLIDEYVDNMKTPNEYIDGIARKLVALGAIDKKALRYFDEIKDAGNLALLRTEMRKIRAYGDPAGRAKEQTSAVSVISQYAEFGLIIGTQRQSDVQFGIDQVDLRLKNKKLFIDANCTRAIDELAGYSYPTDQDGNKKIGEKPVHNELSHGADAIRYWCENNPIRTFSMQKKPDANEYYEGHYFQGARA